MINNNNFNKERYSHYNYFLLVLSFTNLNLLCNILFLFFFFLPRYYPLLLINYLLVSKQDAKYYLPVSKNRRTKQIRCAFMKREAS